MSGSVALSLEREPDYFRGAPVEGSPHFTVVARVPGRTRLAGMGSLSVRRSFVNGEERDVAYLGGLRIDREWRGGVRLAAEGYSLCRSLLPEINPPLCFTSIVSDNKGARRLLESGLPGFPRYRTYEKFRTFVISTGGKRGRAAGMEVRRGSRESIDDITSFLRREYRRYQLAPSWTGDDIRSCERTPGLRAEDFFLALRDGDIVGCLALWDQISFKQAVVREYAFPLSKLRPLVNLLSPLHGAPKLPPVGGAIEGAYLSHVAVRDDDPGVLNGLVAAAAAEAKRRGLACVILGMAARRPMGRGIEEKFRPRVYESTLYFVEWGDECSISGKLDSRVPHLEVATL